MKSAQIGAAGELITRYRLLTYGIESAPLTTDSGIDLVAYLPHQARAITIQVKANRSAKPGGGRGALALDWWLPSNSPADFVSLVDLSTEQIWFMSRNRFGELAQQESGGRWHLYFYIDANRRSKAGTSINDFEAYRLSGDSARSVFELAGIEYFNAEDQ